MDFGQHYNGGPLNSSHERGGNLRVSELDAVSRALMNCRGRGCRVFLDLNGGLVVEVEEVKTAAAAAYEGELWVQGQHFYDSTNFNPDNQNGTEITGTYSTAVWFQINLSARTVAYSATGPAGATFGDNITWRRLSECAGSGKYVMC